MGSPLGMTWNTALVTGASSGIGREFALQLARQRTNLVLVARSKQQLEELAAQLRAGGVDVEVLAADLTDPRDLDRVARRLQDSAAPVDLLVNNAGAGTIGPLAQLPLERELEIVRLNTEALLYLSRVAAEVMMSRGNGAILNMASLAGYGPIPYFAVYSATKAFALNVTLALREELRGTGVSVTAIAPGFVDTDFVEKAGVSDPPLRRLWADPARVARAGLQGAARGQAVVLPGLPVRATSVVSQVLPPAVLSRVSGLIARRLGVAVQQAARNAAAAPAGPPPDQSIPMDDDRALHG